MYDTIFSDMVIIQWTSYSIASLFLSLFSQCIFEMHMHII